MAKNLTIRAQEKNLTRWRLCAQLERMTLSTWISHTLNLEANIVEDSVILRHLETIMFSSSWELVTTHGAAYASIKVEANTSLGFDNGTIHLYHPDGGLVDKKDISFGSFTKKELCRTIKEFIERGLPGLRILIDLDGSLLER